jgi:hypothetical protein
MARRRTRSSRISAAGLPGLRERLAQEAARLMIEHGIEDFGHAKRKAAERLGVTAAGALPSNAQIDASVGERQRIFAPDTHQDHLAHLRRIAVSAMELLMPFRPRLVGPVLQGTATVSSSVELHVFSDTPEQVAALLDFNGLAAQSCQRRLRYRPGESAMLVPGFLFARLGERIIALVFPENGLRQAPLSPVDQRPMRRAGRDEVLALIG